MKQLFIIGICLFSSLSLFAQREISGKVTDEAGEEIVGVTIVQKETGNGTVTDANGNFKLRMENTASTVIQASMISYRRVEVDMKDKSFIRIVLSDEHVGLEEVVVVGYGTQKKVSITGAISNVGNKELVDVPVASVTNALTGRVAGLVTRQESGRPGGDEAKMFIRGVASFNNTDPLVLVDGVERSFSQINQEDIESVSVLKDASATAVYGVRGANGVILVTTRRGEERGRAKINFSAEMGRTEFNRIAQTLNAGQVARFQREGSINDGLDVSNTANTRDFPVSEYDIYLYDTQLSPFTHPDNNFVDIFTKPGQTQKYSLNASGGNRKLKYFVSFSYYNQTGMFQTDVNELRKHPTFQRLIELSPEVDAAMKQPDYNADYYFNRMTARSNLDIQLTDDLQLNVNMSYIFRKQNRPGTYDGLTSTQEDLRLFGQFYRNAPQIFPLINPNGSASGANGVWRQNPLTTMAYTGFRSDYKNALESSFNLQYDLRKVLKGLSIDGKFSFDSNWENWRGMQWRPFVYRYNAANDTYTQGLAAVLPATESGRVAATYKTYEELAVRYRNTFNKKHNLSAVLSGSIQSTAQPAGNTEYVYVPHIYQNLIGRINYDYAGRYLLEVDGGYNGSNRFAEGNRYQFFPAASVGWIWTEEAFFPENKLLSFGKIRASAGKVGNDKLGSNFNYYYNGTYAVEVAGTRNIGYAFGETAGTARTDGLIENSMANDLVRWEIATKYNVGIETQWLNSNLSWNIDFFKERREDILTAPGRYILAAGAIGLPPFNLGIVENKGLETELAWNHQIGNVSYFLKTIYSFNRNRIIERSEAAKPYDYMYQTGLPISQYIGYHFEGFFSSYEEIAASPQQFGLTNLKPGDIKYSDINGDGIVDENDQAPIGYSTIPEVTYSLQAGAEYRGFGVSIMLQGAERSSVYLSSDVGWDNNWGNYFDDHIGRWTPETAATATYPRFHKGADGNHNNYFRSDFRLLDGRYLRIKNIMISYTFNRQWLKKTPFESVRLFAAGYNIHTWDKVKKMDPEVGDRTGNNANDGYIYPQQKEYNFGINISF
jgi:TonB-linked SusC/RagA family outer membrane protein